jgi:hypothetical protein
VHTGRRQISQALGEAQPQAAAEQNRHHRQRRSDQDGSVEKARADPCAGVGVLQWTFGVCIHRFEGSLGGAVQQRFQALT